MRSNDFQKVVIKNLEGFPCDSFTIGKGKISFTPMYTNFSNNNVIIFHACIDTFF